MVCRFNLVGLCPLVISASDCELDYYGLRAVLGAQHQWIGPRLYIWLMNVARCG